MSTPEIQQGHGSSFIYFHANLTQRRLKLESSKFGSYKILNCWLINTIWMKEFEKLKMIRPYVLLSSIILKIVNPFSLWFWKNCFPFLMTFWILKITSFASFSIDLFLDSWHIFQRNWDNNFLNYSTFKLKWKSLLWSQTDQSNAVKKFHTDSNISLWFTNILFSKNGPFLFKIDQLYISFIAKL